MTINIARRGFIKSSVWGATGLIVAFSIPLGTRFMQVAAAAEADKPLPAPNAFLRISKDNTITVILAHSEMGQGVWTTLPMLLADELDADWKTIQVEHAPAAPTYIHTAYGIQITGGSTSTWSEFDRYRQAGALARALLLQAAANTWQVPVSALRTENGHVLHGKQSLTYGQLAEAAAGLPTPKQVTLKTPAQWKFIGKATRRLDSAEKINGTAQFGQDIQFAGLKTAMVARAPVFGASLKSVDDLAALKVKGVIKVVKVPTGVAVIAEHYWAAKQGREALILDWNIADADKIESATLVQQYQQLAATRGVVAANAGDTTTGLTQAKHTISAEYVLPYLSHAPMEPLNCAVKITDAGCEIWTGTQMQTTDQAAAAKICGIAPEKVTIHTQFLGGGFGRRANPRADFVSEAVQVALAAGLPVKTVWSREDDIHGGFYRPMFVHRAEIGIDSNGHPLAWQHTLVGQSIMKGTPFEAFMIKEGVDATSVEGVADSPYVKATAHHHVSLHSVESKVPVLWWRSVGHSHSAFVMESLIDEMAHASKQDPLALRRRLLKDHPRHLATLNLAAEKAQWGKPLPAGVFRGIAVHESFGSYVTQIAEVSVNQGEVKVHRMITAIDCGLVVNPEGVRAQMESCVSFGLGAALKSEISFKQGRVEQSNFHNYQVLRLNEMPIVEVHLVPSTAKLGGVGEPGLPPVAPAVTNAIFAATGKRIRSLPIGEQLA